MKKRNNNFGSDVIPLGADQVHIWMAHFHPGLSGLDAVEGGLSASEVARAGRFRFPKDRDRYIFSTGTLRSILGCYLDLPPAQLRLEAAGSGKSFTAHRLGGRELCFNLSHSGEWVVYAFALERAVGIDVEQVRPMPDLENMVEAYFSPSEEESLRRVGPDSRLRLFFQYWTRKEAYLKARGEGLEGLLPRLDVSTLPLPAKELIPFNSAPAGDPAHWSLMDFSPDADHEASLVVEGYNLEVELCGW